jgi:hypothetical protein
MRPVSCCSSPHNTLVTRLFPPAVPLRVLTAWLAQWRPYQVPGSHWHAECSEDGVRLRIAIMR